MSLEDTIAYLVGGAEEKIDRALERDDETSFEDIADAQEALVRCWQAERLLRKAAFHGDGGPEHDKLVEAATDLVVIYIG